MEFDKTCKISGCSNKAEKLGFDKNKNIIEMCGDCYYNQHKL